MKKVSLLKRFKRRTFKLNRDRMKELILLILSYELPNMSVQKLSYIMYLSDMEAYAQLGEPITGARYIKLPAFIYPWGLKTILTEMKRDRLISL